MGRGKQNRKYKQKKKRMEKIRRGKLVRFDLQNSGRKYSGFRNKYCYQTNIHRLIYKGAKFENVRFQAYTIYWDTYFLLCGKGRLNLFRRNMKCILYQVQIP